MSSSSSSSSSSKAVGEKSTTSSVKIKVGTYAKEKARPQIVQNSAIETELLTSSNTNGVSIGPSAHPTIVSSSAVFVSSSSNTNVGTGSGSVLSSSSGHATGTAAAAAAAAVKQTGLSSSAKMLDLCDRSYGRKYCVARRKKGESGNVVDEKAAHDARTKAVKTSAPIPRTEEQIGGVTGPRLELVNGKMVVKESSLLLSQDTNLLDGEYEEVVEGNHATATYSSFLKRRHSHAWGIEETRMFYQSLRQCGTEFSIMQSFFPGRTRKQLKTKFFREEKQHPELVKKALSTTLPLTLAPFEVTIAENTSGPIPEAAVLSAKRQRTEENQPQAQRMIQSSVLSKSGSIQSHVDDETTTYEEDLDLIQV